MINGKLTRTYDDSIKGHIASLTFDTEVTLSENPFKRNDKHPDFIVEARSPRNRGIRIGSAWEQTSRAGNKYLALAINIGTGTIRANALRREEECTDDETVFEIVPMSE